MKRIDKEERKALTGARVTKEGRRTRLKGDLKARTGGVTTWLSVGSIVLVLQAVESERETIKGFVWELHDTKVARRISMMHGSCTRTRRCATMRLGWEVTIEVTVHDKMSKLRQWGAGCPNYGSCFMDILHCSYGFISSRQCWGHFRVPFFSYGPIGPLNRCYAQVQSVHLAW